MPAADRPTQEHHVAAVFVPNWVTDVTRYVRRAAARALDDRCLHEEPSPTGRWVCVLDVDHEGRHG